MSSRISLQSSQSNLTDSILKKSMKVEKIFNNCENNTLLNEKREAISTSSYKLLSWREKDRRRRFRDEWKHMWLVIPHGNFEVMCLVCHKVMTQRKLDTIKRHTVRRHSEVLEMDHGERIVLFEKLFLEHNSLKFQSQNGINCLSDTAIEDGKPDSEVIDLEKLLSSDCVSATSSSLSPTESRHSNGELNLFSKRVKYSRKNIKINLRSSMKVDSVKNLSVMDLPENTPSKNQFKPNIRGPHLVNDKSFSVWSTSKSDRLMPGNNKPLKDSVFSKFNGSSCLNVLQPMPVISKCPLCLDDCSENGSDINNPFTQIMTHIRQKHSEQLPCVDLNQFGGMTTNDISMSNAISNANFISLLFYQELFRQNVPNNHLPLQSGLVSSDSVYIQNTPVLSMSPMFPLFSSQSNRCSLRQSTSIPSAFIPSSKSEHPKLERSDQISHIYDDSALNVDKSTTLKRAKFSAESLISEANKQSAFYNPKSSRIEEKDVNYNPVSKMPSSISTHLISTESPSSICKVSKMIKNDSYINEPSKIDTTILHGNSFSEPNIQRSLTPKSSAQGNLICHALRFGPGQDLKEGLLEYMKNKKISAAFIMTCCGSLSSATLRMAHSGIANVPLEILDFNKNFEIVSLVGSIFDNGCHLHISLSDSNGNVIGGHVIGNLIIHTTVEVMVGQICGVKMSRKIDENTGYSELSLMSHDSL